MAIKTSGENYRQHLIELIKKHQARKLLIGLRIWWEMGS